MRSEHGGGVPDSTAFAQTLRTMRQEGSCILVVGPASSSAHREICHRLAGELGTESRQRILVDVLDDASTAPTEGGEGLTVQIHRGRRPPDEGQRGATETSGAGRGTNDAGRGTNDERQRTADAGESGAVVQSPLLSTIGAAVLETVDEVADETDLDSADLRLCFDAVTPMLDGHEPQTVFRLLHMLTSRTRELRGIGHFHLPLERDDDYVRLLQPLFDAVVEIRRSEDGDERTGELEQRWSLRDHDGDSGWLSLEDESVSRD
ncbi:DUF7504 family protein [Haloarchaeobius sp. TZWWS8]|uniref:DUF7504 family protein n=1 Tax=Haloarchaeobius sp. TZWWS8 TaxID=3446121 RepID=UPI003EBEB2FB